MENLTRSLKVLWRSERLIRKNELQINSAKIQANALAGLVAIFGLVMLSLAVFFALVPHLGQALAAAAVGIADLVLTAMLVAYARSLKPPPELEMIHEMRDFAISDIQSQVDEAEAELVTLKNDVQKFVKNPVDALLPAMIGPLLSGAARSMKSKKD